MDAINPIKVEMKIYINIIHRKGSGKGRKHIAHLEATLTREFGWLPSRSPEEADFSTTPIRAVGAGTTSTLRSSAAIAFATGCKAVRCS